jgi:hypothetical protein
VHRVNSFSPTLLCLQHELVQCLGDLPKCMKVRDMVGRRCKHPFHQISPFAVYAVSLHGTFAANLVLDRCSMRRLVHLLFESAGQSCAFAFSKGLYFQLQALSLAVKCNLICNSTSCPGNPKTAQYTKHGFLSHAAEVDKLSFLSSLLAGGLWQELGCFEACKHYDSINYTVVPPICTVARLILC